MSVTPISDANRGHAVTIKGVNHTEYLTAHERGPFVLYPVARDLELKLAEAVRLGDVLSDELRAEGRTYGMQLWEAFKASSLKGGAA